jgi:putative membrane protein
MLAVAGLLGHGAGRSGRPILLVVAGCVALLGLGVLGGLAPARRRQLHRLPAAGVDARGPRSVAAVTGAVALAAILGAGSVLTLR